MSDNRVTLFLARVWPNTALGLVIFTELPGLQMSTAFERYIGIDYSGAETCESSLKGLRVYMADRATKPREVAPAASPRKNWTRKTIAHWLVERLAEPVTTLVGIDHGFSFPLKYFEKWSPARLAVFPGRFSRALSDR